MTQRRCTVEATVEPNQSPAPPRRAVPRWSSPAHSRASKLGGRNERHRTAGTTEIQCAVGGRAAVPADSGGRGLCSSGIGPCHTSLCPGSRVFIVAHSLRVERSPCTGKAERHGRSRSCFAGWCMRCAVRAGREGLDGLRVAQRRKLLFFGPEIGYLPGAGRAEGRICPPVDFFLWVSHEGAGGQERFHLRLPYPHPPPKHASSRTHSCSTFQTIPGINNQCKWKFLNKGNS